MVVDIYNTDKKYNIIYADPPWSYNVASKKGTSRGVAERYYNTMKLEDICNLPINKICENAVLFMWATFPNLPQALKVIEKWGFTYKTCAFTWIKKNKKSDSLFWGMGRWTRANAELCLISTKGKPKRQSAKIHSVIISKIREHSRKPDEVRDKIIELCGDLPKIELFARQQVEGWDCWGNEV